MTQDDLFTACKIPSHTTGQKALGALLSEDRIQRIGKGSRGSLYRNFTSESEVTSELGGGGTSIIAGTGCARLAGVGFEPTLDLAGTGQPVPEVHRKEVPAMPVTKEFTIRLEDRPGTLGKLCQALADQNVKILAFQSFPLEKGKSSVHLVLDRPPAARTIFDSQRADYAETKVAQVKLIHRPGELARAASRLGLAEININYGYCGVEPGTNATFLVFGVAETGKAANVLDQAAAASATI
jgi:hypothetical protein